MNFFGINYDLTACSPNQRTKFKKTICETVGFTAKRFNSNGTPANLPASTLRYRGEMSITDVLCFLKQTANALNITLYNLEVHEIGQSVSLKTN